MAGRGQRLNRMTKSLYLYHLVRLLPSLHHVGIGVVTISSSHPSSIFICFHRSRPEGREKPKRAWKFDLKAILDQPRQCLEEQSLDSLGQRNAPKMGILKHACA